MVQQLTASTALAADPGPQLYIGQLTTPVTRVLRDLMPSSGLFRYHTHVVHINTHITHKNKYIFKKAGSGTQIQSISTNSNTKLEAA